MTVPIRTCVGCRRRDEQANLRRFVLVDGDVLADSDRRAPGRGAWLHDCDDCRAAALKRGSVARSLRVRR